MIEKRVEQLENDVRILISLVAKLETEVHELQQAFQGWAKEIAHLKMHAEEMRHIGSAARALS